MSTDKHVILNVDLDQVMVSREKASSAWSDRWRLCGALLVVALCTAGVVFFAIIKTQSSTYENNDIQLSLRQVSASAKAAIHLSARYNSKYTQSVEWRDNEGQSFKQGGLSLVDNKIRIPHNGFYFVYSQASYRVNCSSGSEEGQDMPIVYLSHMVQRWSSSYDNEKPLLNAVRTACKLAPLSPEEEEVEPWFTAIYVGAVFKLQAGDLLYTEMSKDRLQEVETEGGKTFFGVFAL